MKKTGFAARVSELVGLPSEAVAGVPKVTVTGGRRVLVENHKGLLKYSRELIEIKGSRVLLRIEGKNMELISMRSSDLCIGGDIISVDFV